jgi:hypothetical protein
MHQALLHYKLSILLAQSIYEFRMLFKINSGYFREQQ